MKTKLTVFLVILFALIIKTEITYSQALTGYNFKIVNMIPNAQSNEITFDSETNIAVDPANTSTIIGSAFTRNPTGSTSTAPIFVSTDGGTTWGLKNTVPSGNGMTGDISLGFGSTSGILYTGILRGGSSFRAMMLRTATPTSTTTMTTLVDRNSVLVDQPYVSAITVNDASSIPRDRVFTGDNLYGNRIPFGGNGITAEIMFSNDATSAPPAGFANRIIAVRNTFDEDMPATRMAIHNSGVVYGIFYRWISGNPPSPRCDVIVVRDNNFATGTTPFNALIDSGDLQAGQRVVTNRLVPAFGASLGNNRLVASNLAIAVDPINSANVFIAWCDRVSTTDYTVHFRRSTDSGQTWGTSDWLTITNATNPGIAVTTNGKVGLIYQQLTGSGSTARWETHFRHTTLAGTTFSDDILSTFLDSDLSASTISPSLGDYLEIESVGRKFYGVFPASNRPISSNFPKNVSYQRNANFSTNQLGNTSNTANVAVSVDPFFFRISPKFIFDLCERFPTICRPIFEWPFFELPPYPCLNCPPWPCLSCPPFELPFDRVYREVFNDIRPKTILNIPYFHLFLEGYDPNEFHIEITTNKGEPIKQQLNKTKKGYTISFRPSKNNFNDKTGIHNLKITVIPKNREAASKELKIGMDLKASDYQFKEFIARNIN